MSELVTRVAVQCGVQTPQAKQSGTALRWFSLIVYWADGDALLEGPGGVVLSLREGHDGPPGDLKVKNEFLRIYSLFIYSIIFETCIALVQSTPLACMICFSLYTQYV